MDKVINKEFLQDYINKHFKNLNTLSGVLDVIKKMFSFLDEQEYILTPDDILDLLENKMMSKAISIIIKEERVLIKKGQFWKIWDNRQFISLLIEYISKFELDISPEEVFINEKAISCESNDSYIQGIKHIPLLTKEEEYELGMRLLNGDYEAVNTLVEHNLRLVYSIAIKYLGRGLSLDDLIQEGNYSMVQYTPRFDIRRGCRYSTFISYWIEQGIRRSIENHSKNIRIPVYWCEMIAKYNIAQNYLQISLQREPSFREIVQYMKLSEDQIKVLEIVLKDQISLNEPILNSDGLELGDSIPDHNYTPEELVINKLMQEYVRVLINTSNLTERQKKIIILRYGIGQEDRMSLEKCRKLFGMTREGIRQEEKRALDKMFEASKVSLLSNKRPTAKPITIFEYFYNVPKYKIKKALFFINNDELKIINKVLSIINKNSNLKAILAQHELLEFNKSIKRINCVLCYMECHQLEITDLETMAKFMESSEGRKIYNFFPGKSLESIDLAITKLGVNNQRIIKLFEGGQLQSINDWNAFYQIIQRIAIIIKDKRADYHEKYRKTIYDLFIGVSKVDVDNAIKELTEEERELIRLRWGSDLRKPEFNNLDSETTHTLYFSLIPKLKRIISINGQSKKNNDVNLDEPRDICSLSLISIDNLFNLIQNSQYSSLYGFFNKEETIAIALNHGFLHGYNYSVEDIAEFLSISVSDVLETLRKALVFHRDLLKNISDNNEMSQNEIIRKLHIK